MAEWKMKHKLPKGKILIDNIRYGDYEFEYIVRVEECKHKK